VHDPKLAGARAAGRRAGGLARNRPVGVLSDAADLPLGTVAEVTAALAATFNDVRTGRVGVGVGNCLAVLGTALMKGLEASDHEARLAALEALQPVSCIGHGRPR
jgi:hypothetical protein